MRLLPDDHRGRAALRGDNIVPMINVVFLLLIFFLMVAELSKPAPVAVTLPQSAGGAETPPGVVLYLDASGEVAFEDARGASAVARINALAAPGVSLTIRADAGADAAAVAALLTQLSGFDSLNLAVAPE